jgi:nucleoside-triphosphatase THEP1
MTTPDQPAEVERVPWSVLGPDFATVWGRADPADPQPEHMEIVGMNGSGKTYLLAKVLQDRMIVRNSAEVLVCTKEADKTILRLGWPIVDTWEDVRKNRQCIYWPRTTLKGLQRKEYHRQKIQELLDKLWIPDSNTVVAFDEIAYAESLSPDMRATIEMYWREGRSEGITVVGMKQRPQGANRHMSSETWWTAAFVPKDHSDAERFAELFGSKKIWLPVFEQMDPDKHEFLIRHTRSREAYISWIDTPLVPVKPRDEGTVRGLYRPEH